MWQFTVKNAELKFDDVTLSLPLLKIFSEKTS
jgi:hypothetical protein